MADIDRLGTSKPLNQLCSKPGEFDYFQAMRVAHQLVSLGVIESFSVEPPLSMANSVPRYSVGVPSISDASLEDGHLTIYSTFFSYLDECIGNTSLHCHDSIKDNYSMTWTTNSKPSYSLFHFPFQPLLHTLQNRRSFLSMFVHFFHPLVSCIPDKSPILESS